ncbi:MAG: GAF domain-containing protein [Cyanobacteria bacterium J06639_14]
MHPSSSQTSNLPISNLAGEAAGLSATQSSPHLETVSEQPIAIAAESAVKLEPGQTDHPSAIPPTPPQPIEAWLDTLQHQSSLPLALVTVKTLAVQFVNDAFRKILGLTEGAAIAAPSAGLKLLGLLQPSDEAKLRMLFRRHILARVLADYYQMPDLVDAHLLTEPILVQGPRFHQTETQRAIELHLSSDRVRIVSLSPNLIADLQACFAQPPTTAEVMAQLLDPDSALTRVQHTLERDRYVAEGLMLIEGADVTERETLQILAELLLSPESVLQPQKFNQANQLMKALFRADDSLILNAEHDHATLFLGLDQPDWEPHPYSSEQFEQSVFCRAAQLGQVLNVPDLEMIERTPIEQLLYRQGRRSLLLIPLVVKALSTENAQCNLLGMAGLMSDRPYAFHPQDHRHATALAPALAAAMRNTMRDRFTSIHPSVRWRFEQEAERRSWGLPPEPIVFTEVFPLYGISDIRGSSDERNRAIQSDLLAQFQLALAILDAVCEAQPNAYAQQLRLDLINQKTTLEAGITVEAEVTFVRYLQDNLEIHFATFARWGDPVKIAIETYQAACNNEQQCVYTARGIYDHTIQQINSLLRETWGHWQTTMQAITPHYCDVEATDGIDHMIYAGKSIDPNFSAFQLNSLRYEQLRAVCFCARICLNLPQRFNTQMEVTHLVLVQDSTVDITHNEDTERLFDVQGTRDTRYEIVKKRIDKAVDTHNRDRITQPGMLTIVYSTPTEWEAYQQYLHYLHREGWVTADIEKGAVEPLQGVNGLKFARVRVLPDPTDVIAD